MPIPGYIVCAQSGSEDSVTHLNSLFNLFDGLQVARRQPNEPVQHFPFRLVTSWLQSDNDNPNQEFVFQLVQTQPNQAEQILAEGRFSFANSPVSRFVVNSALAGFSGTGVLRFTSRVRPATGGEWQSQSCQILVREGPVAPTAPVTPPAVPA
jgi:hypothetical protein